MQGSNIEKAGIFTSVEWLTRDRQLLGLPAAADQQLHSSNLSVSYTWSSGFGRQAEHGGNGGDDGGRGRGEEIELGSECKDQKKERLGKGEKVVGLP